MNQLVIENIHETFNFKLLKEVYFDILVPCFPDPDDHLKWSIMKRMVKKSFKKHDSNEKILISVSKQRLPDGSMMPVSFFVGVYYRKSRTGLISYMGMRNGCKGLSASNIQKQVLIEMEKIAGFYHEKLKGVFSLVDLPEKADPKYITLPPVQRIRIMERNGARYIPMDFYYPSFKINLFSLLNNRATYKNDAGLLGYLLHGTLPTDDPSIIKAFINDFYRSYGLDPLAVPIVKKMYRQIDMIEKGVEIKLSHAYKEKGKKEREGCRLAEAATV
jgi:sulfur relay (sulfurtransferase) DsrC/TusE family protein